MIAIRVCAPYRYRNDFYQNKNSKGNANTCAAPLLFLSSIIRKNYHLSSGFAIFFINPSFACRKIAAHTACSAQEKWVWRYGDNMDFAKEIYYMDGTGENRGFA